MRLVLSVILFAVLFAVPSRGQAPFMYPGEELVYRVSYLNITLGTIRCVSEPFTTLNGVKCAKVKIYIDTHPNIPFISVHSVYESWMDEGMTYSHRFNANTQMSDNTWEFDQYDFDYSKKKLLMEKWKKKEKVESRSYDIKKRYNDGSSILYAARSLLLSKKTYKLPSVIMGDTVSTVISFQAKSESVEIDAVEYPVKTLYFNGDANWTGIYGLSGRFEGWFSDDEARIPIRAKMKLYVGSALIELQSWKRGTWQPPKAG